MAIQSHDVAITLDNVTLLGSVGLPPEATGLVIFAHGSGSSRLSPRNTFVAQVLRDGGLGTLLFDLLTPEEDLVHAHRFNIDLLTQRLVQATQWVQQQPQYQPLGIGYFGASTGAAAALSAAAVLGQTVRAVVSRGGRPDLAGEALPRISAPTLLIVGGNDEQVVLLNQLAMQRITAQQQLTIVPGATHLFEEPGTLEEVARLATRWFQRYLGTALVGEEPHAA